LLSTFLVVDVGLKLYI